MKENVCCFTGHRNISENKISKIQKRLEAELIRLIQQGVIYFGAGGALGFDTIAALTVIRLRDTYSQIKLILVLPCREQTKGWSNKDKTIYEVILSEADKIVYTSENYYHGCMHKRNRHLVNNSGVCVCYLTKETSGTAYTVAYAEKCGLEIINLALS